jgi:hypothetical protein
MAYMNQEKKAVIKANLDKVLKPLGIKYSLSTDVHSITCRLISSKYDFISAYNKQELFDRLQERQYMQVNLYWLDDNFSGEELEILKKIKQALMSADYYDRSDAMTDYFDTAYYFHCNVGRWDKPYQLVN